MAGQAAHQALNKLTLYPEKARQQFDYVVDWLNDWACTREYGLGTKLPWDQDWVIESLSDSTIYMAYYTIAHHLQRVPADKVDDALFDYVFLGKDKRPDIPHIDDMRAEFEYWYPLDFRNSGKDLIQNHLTFFLFNHAAIFPKDRWPKGIGVNGWVTVDGEKMSKSKGNFFLIRDLPQKWRVDPSRITILSGGEGLDDTNWDSEMAVAMKDRLETLYEFCTTNYGTGRPGTKAIDKWLMTQVDRIVNEATDAMELTNFRTAIQRVYFDMQNVLKWYLKRTTPSKNALTMFIEAQIIMLAPFTPILCEEMWRAIGKSGFVTDASWPKAKKVDTKALASEETVRTVLDDIRHVLTILKISKPSIITIVTAASWKYELYEAMKKNATIKNPGEMIKAVMQTHLKQHGEDVVKLIGKVMNKLPSTLLAPEEEYIALTDAKEFYTKEFGCTIEVLQPDQTKEARAGIALPSKPAIIVK